jgi:uncharacterized protein YodC (DUF2158 family)
VASVESTGWIAGVGFLMAPATLSRSGAGPTVAVEGFGPHRLAIANSEFQLFIEKPDTSRSQSVPKLPYRFPSAKNWRWFGRAKALRLPPTSQPDKCSTQAFLLARSNAMKFQIGDTVRLKSGGPLMTIDNIDAGDGPTVMVTCIWFEETERRESQFPAPALEAGTRTIGGDLHKRARTRR